jgi:hypothetical protein
VRPLRAAGVHRASTGRDPVTGKYAQFSRRCPGYAGNDPEVDTADKARAKLVKELQGDRSGRTAGEGVTVDQLLAKWLKQITSEGRSPATLREYRQLIDKRISPALGYVPARKVTALELGEFYQGLTDEGLAAASVRQVHAILRAGYRQGAKWRHHIQPRHGRQSGQAGEQAQRRADHGRGAEDGRRR